MDKPKFLMQMPKHSYEHIPTYTPGVSKMLPEVEIVGNTGKALDHYRKSFQAKHGQEAIIMDLDGASNTMKDLTNRIGLSKTLELIDYFLSMDTASVWFLKDGHSIAILKKRMEEINASFCMNHNRTTPAGTTYNPKVMFESRCPNCLCWHHISCPASEMDKHAYTDHCPKCLNTGDW